MDQQTLIMGELMSVRKKLEQENQQLRDELQDAHLMIDILQAKLRHQVVRAGSSLHAKDSWLGGGPTGITKLKRLEKAVQFNLKNRKSLSRKQAFTNPTGPGRKTFERSLGSKFTSNTFQASHGKPHESVLIPANVKTVASARHEPACGVDSSLTWSEEATVKRTISPQADRHCQPKKQLLSPQANATPAETSSSVPFNFQEEQQAPSHSQQEQQPRQQKKSVTINETPVTLAAPVQMPSASIGGSRSSSILRKSSTSAFAPVAKGNVGTATHGSSDNPRTGSNQTLVSMHVETPEMNTANRHQHQNVKSVVERNPVHDREQIPFSIIDQLARTVIKEYSYDHSSDSTSSGDNFFVDEENE